MRSIFGRINLNKKPVNREFFENSIEKLSVYSKSKSQFSVENQTGFGQIVFPPFKDEKLLNYSDLVLVSDSLIYNRNEIIQDLQINEKISDDLLILKSYERWGEKCVNHFIGDFAFVIWDSNTEELFCARDHLGIKPLHYYFNKDSFVFSTDIASILEQNDLVFSIDQQQIADTISIVKSEKFRTTYTEIKKLPPAHILILKNNKVEIKSYWKLKPKKEIQKKDIDIINEFKFLLFESVKCRIKRMESVGAELSGGIDSSCITAIASSIKPIKSFSHILPDHKLGRIYPFKDERVFINLLVDHCKIKSQNFVSSEESLLKTLKENIVSSKSLFQQNFGIFSDQLYEKASQENVTVLLSGFGGDEVVTSKSSGYLKELVVNRKWEELKVDLKNQNPNYFKYLKTYIKIYLKSRFPKVRKLRYQKPWWTYKLKNFAITESFFKSYKVKERYYSNYKKLDVPGMQQKNIKRIVHPYVSQRLEYCSLIARKYGIEYRYPLLDIRLIEFYLSVPTRLKARNGIGRYLIRRTIEGIVPEKIQWRNDKSGATIPTVHMRMVNDWEQILEVIKRAKSNKLITQYIDLNKYEQWFDKLRKRSEKKYRYINPGAFYNYLKLILFIEYNPSLFK